MESEITQWLASDNGLVVHWGIFILLVLGGLGFPVPEDIPLLLGGVAINKEIVTFHLMFLTCYLGVMAGDQIMFFIGHRYGERLLRAGTRSRFFPAITENKVNEVREGLRKRRLLYIFIGRHLFPLRSVTFVAAGALRIPYLEFLLADALAALVSVSIMIAIGYWLGHTLTPERIEYLVHEAHVVILIAVLLGVLGILTWRLLRKRNRSPAES